MTPRVRISRRHVLALAGTAGFGTTAMVAGGDWPLWRAFAARFVQPDGRVIDDQAAARYTTSEGQAYALFFSLVANDRAAFDVLFAWTERHLAGDDLAARLPGWRWGRRDDGAWTLLDANPATDADLWLAYALLEAARLWGAPTYRRTGQAVLARIRQDELLRLPGVGWMPLPAPAGFQLGPASWRLNPSYVALHQMRYFAQHDPQGPWNEIAVNTVAMLGAAAPCGFAPDWVSHDSASGWHADATSPPEGSYDAIRTYLWAGLLDPADPLRPALLQALRGMRDWLASGHAAPPERVRTDRCGGAGTAPIGFSAALLPYLEAFGERRLVEQQAARLRPAAGGPTAALPTYFDAALTLFGQGAMEARVRFDRDGALQPRWGGMAKRR